MSAFGFGSLASADIQGQGPANLYYGFGAKKTFRDGRLDVSLNVTNPFNNTWTYRNTLTTSFFNEVITTRPITAPFRSASATASGRTMAAPASAKPFRTTT